MPRDSSGIYTLPAGNPVVTGTTVESDWANDTMADIQAALTDSLSRTGNGGMQAAFLLSDGTEGTPAFAFTNAPTTGLWRDSTGDIVFSISGVEVLRIKSDNTILVNDVVMQTVITGAATTITDDDLTASRAIISNGSGKVAASSVTSSELAYLSGVTSAIQTQLDAMVEKAGDTMTGQLTLPGGGSGSQALTATEILSLLSHNNLLINSCGTFINQRGVAGTVVLSSGEYGHDRWKAGSGGCTYTFSTTANVTTINISSGTLVQVVEGRNIQTGTHVLSWTGTAQAQINSGGYGDSGLTASLTGGSNATIEIGTGTFSNMKLEKGSTATPVVPRHVTEELNLCQRYYQLVDAQESESNSTIAGTPGFSYMFNTEMRTAPSATEGFISGGGISSVGANTTVRSLLLTYTINSTSWFRRSLWALDAEL